MKVFLSTIVALLILACISDARIKDSKRQSILATKIKILKASLPVIAELSPNGTASTTTPQAIPTVDVNFIKTAAPTKRILRTPNLTYVERKCCKLGFRGGKKGFSCDWDRYTAFRYTNMEHRMKMKFFGRKPSKRTQRFVKHVVNFCVKTGLKRLFQKCCRSA
uniref:Uncharacterized protein LOC116288774 n=1 Tax=Actinia tenebrosa TaxID=6105 RepID=A0A6P8HFU8_ACTTE